MMLLLFTVITTVFLFHLPLSHIQFVTLVSQVYVPMKNLISSSCDIIINFAVYHIIFLLTKVHNTMVMFNI